MEGTIELELLLGPAGSRAGPGPAPARPRPRVNPAPPSPPASPARPVPPPPPPPLGGRRRQPPPPRFAAPAGGPGLTGALQEEEAAAAEGGEEEEAEEEEEEPLVLEVRTAPVDPRFPAQNQAKHCYTRYQEFHKCAKEKDEEDDDCKFFKRAFKSLCPNDWVEAWDEQRDAGLFPGGNSPRAAGKGGAGGGPAGAPAQGGAGAPDAPCNPLSPPHHHASNARSSSTTCAMTPWSRDSPSWERMKNRV